MNKNKENFNNADWNDFAVANQVGHSSAKALYQSYKVFMERFANLPKNELVKRGWIKGKTDFSSLTGFYKDIHEERGGTLFRKLDAANAALSSLWLSDVGAKAKLYAYLNAIPRFEGISKHALKIIAQLSVDVDVVYKLPRILAEYGIVLIYSRALPNMKLDGAVFKLESGTPVIGISFRYPRLDHFWFTLLHELAHIHLHMDLLDKPIIDDLDIQIDSEIELSANRLAKNSFVSNKSWRNCEPKYDKSFEAIENFAKEINIHKSIVAGMLAHEDGNYQAYARILNEFNIRELIFKND